MPYYKFGPDDIFYNKLETRPSVNFKIYDRNVYYNNRGNVVGQFVASAGAQNGYISLYEMNVDRPSGQLIYPFVTKDGSLNSFSTVSTSQFNSDFVYGDQITGSYPLAATISSHRYCSGCSRLHIDALRNTLNSYKMLTPAYAYSSSLGDKSTQQLRLISIPSIFYGAAIQKGTVSLKFYISGTLIGELQDNLKNGELRQTLSTTAGGYTAPSGSVAGVVLYNEGFMILTGSWPISDHTEPYTPGDPARRPLWLDFGSTGSAGLYDNLHFTSFDMSFSGTTYIPTLTMFAHAREGMLNHSNNPTAITYGKNLIANNISASTEYMEPTAITTKNIGSSSFDNTIPAYEKTVFINQIGIYDDDKNLIAIAKFANPIRKRNQDDFTFKLKLDF